MNVRLHERYAELMPDRDQYLRRARACAALTVPAVCPPEGHTGSSVLPQTYTSFGARATTNLASKLLMSLLPPGASSFQLNVPVSMLVKEGVLTTPPEIIKGLAQCEQLVNAKIEALKWRRPTFISLLHLIVAGNVVEYITPDGRIKLFRLDQFVCVRDWSGTVLEIVTAERMKARALPANLRGATAKKEDEAVVLYTRFERIDEDTYAIEQALDDRVVTPRAEHHGIMPANALGWEVVPGETYARSHVEANYSDLVALDANSKHIQEGIAVAARNLIFVKPNAAGGNLRKRIAEARNGSVLSGNSEDVEAFQFNNGNALQGMRDEKQDLQRGLAQAFLLTGDLRRDAERVTAYELRMLAQEIEAALGGTYSLLATEMQAWRLRKLMAQMKARQELPDFGENIDITVTTGLEALGRDEQVNRVRSFFGLLNETPAAFQQEAASYVKFDTVLTPAAAALGFPGSIRTAQEVEQLQAQQQQQELLTKIAQGAAGPAATAALQQNSQ